MNRAVAERGSSRPQVGDVLEGRKTSSERFGTKVFSRKVMETVLPRPVFENIVNAIDGKEDIKPEYADTIAAAMREWAVRHGATHYCHWFLPLTGSSAEKHDSFIEFNTPDQVIEQFNGFQLIQGEPDASSFPSGGLRSTYEARGYTGWDPSSPAFLWRAGDGYTLCIPSVFFSYNGEVLDAKIPLLRSDKKIESASLRLLKLLGMEGERVFSTLGWEQEFFIVDREWRNLRPDLRLLGSTVFGAPPPKGQELDDHYFGSVKDRILEYMCDMENRALELGIPMKTRHNEVAPAQHEFACVYEQAVRSVDHNIQLMELMRQVAVEHNLACLLHEKPFAGLNGSGKHNNWSLGTDTGLNLLDPTSAPESSLRFLILLTAVLSGLHRHSGMLRASIASRGCDHRLGGHEAPPAIMSVFLGEALEKFLDDIESKGAHTSAEAQEYDLGIPLVPKFPKANTDRNRTSPFAFTGNKFEFRAVGSALNSARVITVINCIVAESLDEILDEVESQLVGEGPYSREELVDAVMPVVQRYLKASRNIRFMGDNYTEEWREEAQRRGLPNHVRASEALQEYVKPETVKLFKGVLSEKELQCQYEVLLDRYVKERNIEINLMLEIFHTQIFPAVVAYQGDLAKSLCRMRENGLEAEAPNRVLAEITAVLDEAAVAAQKLEEEHNRIQKCPDLIQQAVEADPQPLMDHLRKLVDTLETRVDRDLWPLPSYSTLLFFE